MPKTALPSTHLVCDRLRREYGARRVLRSLSLQADAGEVVSVVGANGSGKSTLLKIAAGLLRPSGGMVTLTVQGTVFASSAERRTQVAYAAPDLMFYPELTGRENLQFFARMRRLQPDTEQLLTRVGLHGRGDDATGAYSSGMRQRLRLALAWLFMEGGAALLLLDEPSLALDERGVELIAEIVAEQRMSGGVTLLATNDRTEAGLGDRSIALG